MQALLRISNLNAGFITSEDVAFRLGPRLNAAGRIEHALTAFNLITVADHHSARKTAELLNDLNSRRQAIERDIFQKICSIINDSPDLLDKNALVFSDPGWHEGVLGIVASSLAKKYFQPVVLISTRSGTGKGSGRSIPGFNLYHALRNCSDCLEKFGGHSMAAGLRIDPANIDKFYGALIQEVKKQTRTNDFKQVITIDARINFNSINETLLDELESLMPFGEKNREPLFIAGNIKLLSASTIGQNHCRMRLMQTSAKTGRNFSAIVFHMDADQVNAREFDEILFRLRWNRWKKSRSIQLVIAKMR